MKLPGPGFRRARRRAVGVVVTLLILGCGFASTAATETDARSRLLALRAEIARHDDLYFKQAAPEISDAAYDALKRELHALEAEYPELATEPPVVGDDRSGRFPTHPHAVRMLSLDKAYTEAEWRAFHARVLQQLGLAEADFVIEPKYDGVAVSLTYEQGRLVRALTRGNGREGDDVTDNVRRIAGVREALHSGAAFPSRVELRGEVYVTTEEFARLNSVQTEAGRPLFAHPRNLAAGTLKSSDPDEGVGRNLSLVIHGWGAWDGAPAPESGQAFQATVRAWGLPGVEPTRLARSVEAVWDAVRTFARERVGLGFPIDGVVVKLNDTLLQRRLGESDTAPRWAIACKFSPERAVTRLRGVAWPVGRTGVLTPVAEFDPVDVGGATVARATLHNPGVVARLGLHVGDFVEIERAGEIIPTIVSVQIARRPPGALPVAIPENCPTCESALAGVGAAGALRCPNPECPAQRLRRLEHFVACVGIEGFGPATLAALVGAGAVRSPADLYRLRREDLLALDGVGPKTADRLLASIERSKWTDLARFIQGLGIPQVGEVTARRLAALAGILSALSDIDASRLEAECGPAAAAAVRAFLDRPEWRAELLALEQAGVRPTPVETGRSHVDLAGKVFVFTGTLPGLARTRAVAWVEAAGGLVRDQVSAQTDYVVAGDSPGSKLAEARKRGVPILTLAEFKALLGQP